MANLFEHKDRRVIPNWRSFGKTLTLGELDSHNNVPMIWGPSSIDDYILDWEVNKTVTFASDLMSAGLVNNKKDNKSVKEAANFVLNNRKKATRSQISLAEYISNDIILNDFSNNFPDISLDILSKLIEPTEIWLKIKSVKELVRIYPYNPINYVEISRLYSIIGQEENSVKAMKTALHLAPNNRFVLRSATRLFAHFDKFDNGYLEYIHDILRKSSATPFDPWLMSAEISLATVRNRNSKFIKKGIDLVNSRSITPFSFTELASSLGTVELLDGGIRKSRELFNKALISPNDNSLAQIEWASTKDKQLDINPEHYKVRMKFEALALDNYHNRQYDQALENAIKWFVDMPYSKRPIMFGSNLASTILKDQKKSIAFLNAGLTSHPNDPQLINNIAYSLSLDNRPDEAFQQLNKLKNNTDIDDATGICLIATQGLALFRSGQEEQGRTFYLDAIKRTKEINNQELNWIAILNYAREEILVKSEFIEPIYESVIKIPAQHTDLEISILKEDVIKLYDQYNANKVS